MISIWTRRSSRCGGELGEDVQEILGSSTAGLRFAALPDKVELVLNLIGDQELSTDVMDKIDSAVVMPARLFVAYEPWFLIAKTYDFDLGGWNAQ